MPTPAEGFIIVLIVVVVFAIYRLPGLGDALGNVLRNLVMRRGSEESSVGPAPEDVGRGVGVGPGRGVDAGPDDAGPEEPTE